MKKFGMLGITLLVCISLMGCSLGSESPKKKGETKTAEVSKKSIAIKVLSGTYVIPKSENDEKYLSLRIKLTNNSTDTERLLANNFSLVNKEKEATNAESYIGYSHMPMDDDYLTAKEITADTSLTGNIVFKIEKQGVYTLNYAPNIKKAKPISLKIDTRNYEDKSKEAEKALKAYVNEVYLGKSDLYADKYVENSLTADKKEFDTEAKEKIQQNFTFSNPIADKDLTTLLKELKKGNASRGHVAYTLESFSGEDAYIGVKVRTISLTDLNSQMSDLSNKIQKETNYKATYKETQSAVIGIVIKEFPEILTKMPLKTSTVSTVHLKKVNSKWKIDTEDIGINSTAEIAKKFEGTTY